MNESPNHSQLAGLYVVATPIGNLEDFSPRARRCIEQADLLCCEDTRETQKLLQLTGVRAPPMWSLHDHNEAERVDGVVAKIAAGAAVALVSDAGTPLISDPGFRLVRAVRAAQLPVFAVPGPCAAIAALSIAGLPSDRFFFEGFLPAQAGPRRSRLSSLVALEHVVVIYESAHRIVDTLQDLTELTADRQVVIAREITKRFETVLVGTAADLHRALTTDANQQRGEFVLLIAGQPAEAAGLAEAVRLARTLCAELPASKAAKIAARYCAVDRRALYEALLASPGVALK